jgi:hydroxypyruvate isomerase
MNLRDPSPASPSRRNVLAATASAAAAAAVAGVVPPAYGADDKAVTAANSTPAQRKGRIQQSACKWCYGKIPLDEFAAAGKAMGLVGIDLLGPADFPTLKKHGLVCTMVNSHGIHPGLNKKKNHEKCLAEIRKAIEATSEAGYKNVICFSGNREGQDDEEGMKVCAEALKQVVGLAEEKKVTLCMELLNSKVDHKDYMCDHTKWGVDLCRMVGSERFKLLYDIYHMQIMEGDVIRTMRDYKDYIGHIHTGGVPGRNEIDEGQELYYPAIMKAIADMGFKGYVAQEFIPRRDPLASLRQAVEICDV